jgi:hypothetical protein
MTKFDELNKIYTTAEQDFKDYRWNCIEFAIKLGKGLANYLECDYEEIQYYQPPDNDGKAIEVHPRDALLIDKDTSWHYGMGINLYVENNMDDPSMTYIFDLALKKDKENFILNLLNEKKEFNLESSKPEDLKPFYDMIYNTIKNRFEEELTKFLKNKSYEHFPEYG